MDVKELNKSQLILLALLLSFVTSIATGIVTVTLMQQAPDSVTTPINNIIRQTVEKIVPNESPTVQTVVVKEEDLVVAAIAKNQSAIFAITKNGIDATTGQPAEVSAGKGFAVSKDGIIVADASMAPDNENYFVKNESGKFKATFISVDKNGFSFLKIGDPVDGKSKLSFAVPTFGDLSTMKAGQKIIILGSSISSFIFDGSKDLGISPNKANAGALVLDLDGDALGIALSNSTPSFVPISTITSALKPGTVQTN
jgi:hypothetical protein